MPLICYTPKNLRADSLAIVEHANNIIAEYLSDGLKLTLRQLYYQFVSRDLIRNQQKEYKRLGGIVSDARLCGLIDWNAIEDRTRELRSRPHWDSPADIISAAARSFGHDLWADQPRRVEVWIEKDALVGVIERVCRQHDTAYFSCRGYTSQSEMWAAGQRLRGYARAGQAPLILHLGDHDPSGIDMSRDIADRLELFAGGAVEVRRIALNYDQVEAYGPPPNPAKLTDSRASGYLRVHGRESWELDALEPRVLSQLIEDHITGVLDTDRWNAALRRQEKQRELLTAASDRWDEVADFLLDN